MSYNGSGVYTLPGAQLVNGKVVSATENNTFRNDVATALNTAWTRDGQAPASANIPMNSHKFTGLAAGSSNGDSVRYEQVTSDVDITGGTITGVVITDLVYDGSLTGTGNADITGDVSATGVLETQSGVLFSDGTTQTTAFAEKSWTSITSTGTYTVPANVYKIRVYAFGAGGNGGVNNNTNGAAGGGGGGCAYGDVSVTPGDIVEVTISSGIATVVLNGTTLLTANNGGSASGNTAGTGGTASKHTSVTNGGAYTGGAGGTGAAGGGGGGGSAASPLGNGYDGGAASGGGGGGAGAGGIGGSGNVVGGGGGGAGGAGNGSSSGGSGGAASGGVGGKSRSVISAFADPILANCNAPGNSGVEVSSSLTPGLCGGPGAGGSGSEVFPAGIGGDFAGGGGSMNSVAGIGGFGGGGGGSGATGAYSFNAADGGYGGGGGGASKESASGYPTAGSGGAAIVIIYA